MSQSIFSISIEYKTTDEELRRYLIETISERVQLLTSSSSLMVTLERNIQRLVADQLFNSATSRSLLVGILKHQLGIVDAAMAVNAIINEVMDSVEVGPLAATGSLIGDTFVTDSVGGINVSILPDGLDDLLQMDEASYDYISARFGPTTIPWLEWLLKGRNPILGEFHFLGKVTPASRTGLGIMVRGGFWSVPAPFDSNGEDNWISREFKALEEPITKLMIQTLDRMR